MNQILKTNFTVPIAASANQKVALPTEYDVPEGTIIKFCAKIAFKLNFARMY